jgi:hypothetical protein
MDKLEICPEISVEYKNASICFSETSQTRPPSSSQSKSKDWSKGYVIRMQYTMRTLQYNPSNENMIEEGCSENVSKQSDDCEGEFME